jgi:hypothetical protein
VAKQGLLPGIGKREEEEEEEEKPKKKVKKKMKKKKVGEGELGPPEGEEMPMDEGDLPPGITMGEGGELIYSEEEQLPPGEMALLEGEVGEDGEVDISDEIAALAQEEGLPPEISEDMEPMDELDADIQAIMEEEEAEMQELTEMEPMAEEKAEDVEVQLPDDDEF